MKLLDLIKELDKKEEINIANLTQDQRDELLKKGSIMIPIKDPTRPEVTSASQVISLPKTGQIKIGILKNKEEFDIFNFSSDPEIKAIAKEISSTYSKLYKAMNDLDNTLKFKKSGRI